VLAHILGEMGALFLSNVCTRTFLPIFIEIGTYSTDTEQRIVGTFFETLCKYVLHIYLLTLQIYSNVIE